MVGRAMLQMPTAHQGRPRWGPVHLWCQHQQMKLRALSNGVWREGGWGRWPWTPETPAWASSLSSPGLKPGVHTGPPRTCGHLTVGVAEPSGPRGTAGPGLRLAGTPSGDGSAALGPSLGGRTPGTKPLYEPLCI